MKSTLDFLLFLPLIPVIPVLLAWWLPWERWLWERIPAVWLGPYIVYGSVVAYHFDLPRWACILYFVMGASISTFALYDHLRKD